MVKTLQDTRMQLQRGEATSQDLVSEALAALNSPEAVSYTHLTLPTKA